MSPNLATTNTSPTPTSPGRWVVTEFGKPDVLKWQSWDPTSEVSGDNVLVRIIIAGLGGVDNIQRVGGFPDPRAYKPGFSTGYEIVGEVLALGDTIPKESKLAIGDRVVSMCCYGGHATHVVLPYEVLLPIKPTDDPVKVAALPVNYMTAWGMLKRSGFDLPPGSSILIGSASGGVGTAVAQLVTAFKMDLRMLGTCSPSKFDYIRSLGVEPIDRNASDIVQQVRKLTDGAGVDVAYDGVCSEDSVKNFLAATKPDTGRLVVFGLMSEITSDGSKMLHGAQDTLGRRLQQPRTSFFHLSQELHKKPEVDDFHAIVDKVRTGELDPVIAKLLPLSKGVEGHQLLVDGSAIKGKLLFVVDADLAAKLGG